MSLREAVGPYAHQKQISNKFSRKVSAILIASHCTCKHFLNTMTFLLLFLYKVTLGRVIYDREFIVKAEKKKKVTEEGKLSQCSVLNTEVAAQIQLETQENLYSALFWWHPFPIGVKSSLMLASESPGSSRLWAVMTTTGLGPWALDTFTHCMDAEFVANPFSPLADCCPLPIAAFFQLRDHEKLFPLGYSFLMLT